MLKKEIEYVDEPQDSFRISNMLQLLKILQTRLMVGAYHANSEYMYIALICKMKNKDTALQENLAWSSKLTGSKQV